MNKMYRTPIPEWLNEKHKEWGENWERNYSTKKKFSWRQNKGKGSKDLQRELMHITKNHCSFCDAYPMGMRIAPTIEHFRPKTKFPLIAYQWENLFIACNLCQQKGNEFDERLLKPDTDDYDFDRYFDIKWDTGEIVPNPVATDYEQQCAQITISLYRLNRNGKPEDRLEELEKYNPKIEIDKWAYRFFIERGVM